MKSSYAYAIRRKKRENTRLLKINLICGRACTRTVSKVTGNQLMIAAVLFEGMSSSTSILYLGLEASFEHQPS